MIEQESDDNGFSTFVLQAEIIIINPIFINNLIILAGENLYESV